jgi:hypothetical protein
MRRDLLVLVAEHLLPARGVHDVAGFEIEIPDAFAGAGHGEGQPLLAFAEARLIALPRGDVAHHQLQRVGVERRNGDLDHHLCRTGVGDPCLHACPFRSEPRPGEPAANRLARLRREQIEGGSPDDPVSGLHRAQPQGRGVRQHQAVVSADEDAIRRTLHQKTVLFRQVEHGVSTGL